MKQLYLVLDGSGEVVDLTFEKTETFYCDVFKTATIKELEEVLELDKYHLYFENDALIAKGEKTKNVIDDDLINEIKKLKESQNKQEVRNISVTITGKQQEMRVDFETKFKQPPIIVAHVIDTVNRNLTTVEVTNKYVVFKCSYFKKGQTLQMIATEPN